jgi:hypothetical protein
VGQSFLLPGTAAVGNVLLLLLLTAVPAATAAAITLLCLPTQQATARF